MSEQEEEKKPDFDKIYGQSDKGNFRIINDDLVFPHPYMIGSRLVGFTADHHGGMLTTEAIRDAEDKQGIMCEMKMEDGGKCERGIDEHEKGLMVECKIEMWTKEGKGIKEIHDYLLKIKPIAEKNGFRGFGFVDTKGKGMGRGNVH